MNYADKQYAGEKTTEVCATLLSASGELVSGLSTIEDRLKKLGDHLLGGEPRPAGNAKDAPEPAPSVFRNLDRATGLIQLIDTALTRIEQRA